MSPLIDLDRVKRTVDSMIKEVVESDDDARTCRNGLHVRTTETLLSLLKRQHVQPKREHTQSYAARLGSFATDGARKPSLPAH